MQDVHFISGLPRSGSTLLAAILRQNPKFTASIMTPVGRIFSDTMDAMSHDNEAANFLTAVRRANILRGIFYGYYSDDPAWVVFDNNRRWCANVAALEALFPDSKVICCVRNPAAIVDSFERLFRANPLSVSVIYKRSNLTIYERVKEILAPQGVLGFALNAFRDAYYTHLNRLLIIDYNMLAQYPMQTMRDLHKCLGYEAFEYDFNDIQPIPGAAEFDEEVQTPGLHDLKPRVVYEPRTSILPPELFAALPKPFWVPDPVKEEATKAA